MQPPKQHSNLIPITIKTLREWYVDKICSILTAATATDQGKIKILMTKSKIFSLFKTGDHDHVKEASNLENSLQWYTDANETHNNIIQWGKGEW